jgi:hypothetical protein
MNYHLVLQEFMRLRNDEVSFEAFLKENKEDIKVFIYPDTIPATFHGKWKQRFLYEVRKAGLKEKVVLFIVDFSM